VDEDCGVETILEEEGVMTRAAVPVPVNHPSIRPKNESLLAGKKGGNHDDGDDSSHGGQDSPTGHSNENDSSEKTPPHDAGDPDHDGDDSASQSTPLSLLQQSFEDQDKDQEDGDAAGDDDENDVNEDEDFGSVHLDDEEDDEDDNLFDSLDEEFMTEDPTGNYVANLEQEQHFRWKKLRYEELSQLLHDKWSVTVVPTESGRKIAVGSLVKRKKKLQWEGEVIEKVGKKWKVRTDESVELFMCDKLMSCSSRSCARKRQTIRAICVDKLSGK
jgi:hypothetical protein